jgi:hypothetical protein
MELFLVIGALVVVFLFTRKSVERDRHRVIARGAAKIERQLSTVYGGVHEYQEVDLADFPFLDHAYYAAVTDELTDAGFSLCADVEDATMTRANPRLRTCLRTMLGDGGLIRAGIADVKPTGSLRLLQILGLIPRHTKDIELVSEVSTGKFLSTSNTHGLDQMTMPGEFQCERMPSSTGASALLERHRERLAQLLKGATAASPIYFRDYDDVIASAQRGNVILSRHREELGGLTREELERIVKRPLKPREQALLDELDRKRDRDGDGDGDGDGGPIR